MSGSPFGIGEFLGAQEQSKQIGKAASLEAKTAQAMIDLQLKMWEQAQADFAPYLQAGTSGLATLQNQMPQYVNSQLLPMVQQFNRYNLNPLPSAQTGMVNPVTGQVTQYSPQSQMGSQRMQSAYAPNGYNQTSQGAVTNALDSAPQPLSYAQLSQYTPQQQNAFAAQSGNIGATQQQLEQGGVLSPLVPDFQRELNFQFNPDDPTFKIKSQMKNEEINTFLAKQGLLGSTAGESYRQRELDKFRAEEEDTQYNRALTERNYLTQTDVDKYGLDASRGDTLYNRQYQAGNDFQNRAMNSTLTEDARNQQQIMDKYNLASNLYGLQYGGALDLSKMGAGAAGSAGQNSFQTGQGVGSTAANNSANQANAILAQGNVMQNYLSGLSNQGSQVGNAFMNYYGSGGGGGYYSAAPAASSANNMWGGDTSWAAFY